MICVFLIYDGNSRRLNRKRFYGEAGNPTCNPDLQGIAHPLHHGGYTGEYNEERVYKCHDSKGKFVLFSFG